MHFYDRCDVPQIHLLSLLLFIYEEDECSTLSFDLSSRPTETRLLVMANASDDIDVTEPRSLDRSEQSDSVALTSIEEWISGNSRCNYSLLSICLLMRYAHHRRRRAIHITIKTLHCPRLREKFSTACDVHFYKYQAKDEIVAVDISLSHLSLSLGRRRRRPSSFFRLAQLYPRHVNSNRVSVTTGRRPD